MAPLTHNEDSPQENRLTVVLANAWRRKPDFPVPLAKVATLPVALRAVLGARKAGARKILVVMNSETGPEVRRALTASRRLPPEVDWLEIPDAEFSLPALARNLAAQGVGRVTLVLADAVHRPSLHQRAADWDGRGGFLAFITNNQPVGIFCLSANGLADLAAQPASGLRSSQEFLAWLFESPFARFKPVADTDWQPIQSPRDITQAEHKLDHWLVKPTDGIFARFNRHISIPISHQLIKTLVTPNMVSILTLGVGLLAGLCFGVGGYLPTLLGALLSVLASILDGCDGEVARLTFQESAFGCWLETVCDYLYYILIFGGMAIGLARRFSSGMYAGLTSLLFFGAVLSMLVTSRQRRTLAAERPERYLAAWQRRADKQHSFLVWFGRHTEFIIRRCFLPYALLAFALCNAIQVAFIMCAFGANVVWLIALYSNHRPVSPVPTQEENPFYLQSGGNNHA